MAYIYCTLIAIKMGRVDLRKVYTLHKYILSNSHRRSFKVDKLVCFSVLVI